MRHGTAISAGAAFGVSVLLLSATITAPTATEALARETATTCTACHDKPGSRLLTDRGKYYELMRTMDGYERVIENFGHCTYCHSTRPGSTRLTREGKRFEKMLGDMDALKAWLDAHHPAAGDRSVDRGAENRVKRPAGGADDGADETP